MNAEHFVWGRHKYSTIGRDPHEIMKEWEIHDYITTSWSRTSTGRTRFTNIVWGKLTAQEFIQFFSSHPITDIEGVSLEGDMVVVHTIEPGRWIGKGGKKIKALRRLTGLNIEIRELYIIRQEPYPLEAQYIFEHDVPDIPFVSYHNNILPVLATIEPYKVGEKWYGPPGDGGHRKIGYRLEARTILNQHIHKIKDVKICVYCGKEHTHKVERQIYGDGKIIGRNCLLAKEALESDNYKLFLSDPNVRSAVEEQFKLKHTEYIIVDPHLYAHIIDSAVGSYLQNTPEND